MKLFTDAISPGVDFFLSFRECHCHVKLGLFVEEWEEEKPRVRSQIVSLRKRSSH